jgi:putative ABC transport system substrate-binding protein
MHFTDRSKLPRLWLFIGFLLLLQCQASLAAERKIAIIYPIVEKPYSTVFEQIIDGISEQAHTSVSTYGLDKLDDNQRAGLESWVLQQQPEAVIALGRRGIKGVRDISLSVPTVFSGVLYASSETISNSPGISLTPDPKLLLKQLKTLAPKIKRVYVVYNPGRYQWLIDLADKAAHSLGLNLIAEAANDLRESAKKHREILRKANRKSDALWLLQDPGIVATTTILPMILRESWNNRIVVFSSNPSDVPRGALFSYYADNRALGRDLARLALSTLKPNYKASFSIEPLSSALSAINIRTAGHIGIQIPFEQQKAFSLVFPRK